MRPLREPAFARLWTAAFFSESAEWMLQVALPVFIYQATGSAASTAASVVLGLLPAVLLSPVAGVLADRWNRRIVLCAVCAGQAVVAMPLLLVSSSTLLVVVYLVMAAQAGLASLFEPARNALIPELVGPDDVTGANGLMSVNSSVARLAGGWLGGVLLGVGGLGWVVAVYLASLAVAAAILLKPFAPATNRGVPAEREPMVRAWIDGLAEIARSRKLRVTGVALVLMSLAQGMFLVLFVVFVLKTLSGGEADVGLLRGVQAIGGLVAGMSVATIAREVAPEKLLGWGTLVLGVLSAVIWDSAFLTTALPVYIGLFMAVGMPGVFAGAGLLTVIQAGASTERAGRVLSTGFAGMAAFTALGALAAGVLIGPLGLAGLLNVQATLHVGAGLVVLLGLVRSRKTVEEPQLVTVAPL
ncbi:MFS transporter [Amycolatopsis sp.]|uniref:MFS transporter n=1 Tax=Amycolatopsis sp. TaxID=37632 RepID=UPI002E02953A|nr:MFS transporter [Amycolatopsis sp.]